MSRRQFCVRVGSLAVVSPFTWRLPFVEQSQSLPRSYPLYEEAVANVIPPAGLQTRIALQDSVLQLVEYGVIDRGKFFAIMRSRVPPSEVLAPLVEAADEPILITTGNAGFLVNLLWPLGLANHMAGNFASPLNSESGANFASTGGWSLGAADNGAEYFNAFPIIKLTRLQELLVLKVAKSTYRPCCDNSTFFQDCNHGSALLAALQLGASQGLNEEDLYRDALAFNSFWFPDIYIKTALYMKLFKSTDWRDVDPAEIMGFEFSALSSWQRNVGSKVEPVDELIPSIEGGANCGA